MDILLQLLRNKPDTFNQSLGPVDIKDRTVIRGQHCPPANYCVGMFRHYQEYSLVASPMCPIGNPEMLSTSNFYDGNVIYVVWKDKLA